MHAIEEEIHKKKKYQDIPSPSRRDDVAIINWVNSLFSITLYVQADKV